MAEGYSYQTGKRNTFHVVDYVIFGGILAISASIGIFYAIRDRKKNNIRQFLMAGKDMNPIPVALSLLASFMSAITLLGAPAEMYNFTTMYFWIGLSYFFVVAGAAHIFIPIFYNLKVTSAYEYLEYRFGKTVRTAGSMTFVVQMVLYMSIVLYAPSLALNAVTGFTLWGSVISVGVVCTLYTTLGGMKAVLWTDTFQVGMMFAGLLAVLIKGSMVLGGFSNAWEIAARNERVIFDDFSPDPSVRHSAWALVIGGYFTWVAIYGTNQAQVQRACTCPTLKKAQLAMWINFPGLCFILYICCLIGIVIYAFYSTCDPISFKLVSASDQLLPLFVMDVLGDITGLPGLFVACIFSGALSTVSSGLNSLAAVLLEDVVKSYIAKDLTEERATLISKIIALVLGVVCLGLTYVASVLGSVLQAALSLFGMIGGPLLGLFTLGMMFPWANKWGAGVGLGTSLVMLFWIGIGAQVHKPPQPKPPINTTGCNWNLTTTMAPVTVSGVMSSISTVATTTANNATTIAATVERSPDYYLYTLSYLWYSATAVLIVVVVGLVVSFITGHTRASDVDPRLICPIFDILFPFNFLPESIRKPLRFGINHEGKYDRPSLSCNKTPAELKAGEQYRHSGGPVPIGIHAAEKGEGLDKNGHAMNGLDRGSDNPGFDPPPYSETSELPSTRL
ncbi:sodium-coupled monocarboxylate transporter 1-like [Haliotis cracherodii]|uniref:sodium-coupled monocarboxylate transporter 1-like n=1 Tax=Haliotis cracherodii TaxID=6455 RepID=UPI0039E8F29F